MKKQPDEESDDESLRVDAGVDAGVDAAVDAAVVVNPILPGDSANDQAAMDLFYGIVSSFCAFLVGSGGRDEEGHQGGFVPDAENEREVRALFVVGDCKKTQ